MAKNELNKPGCFFDGFAVTFDSIYDGKRSTFMQWVDRKFRRDMFERFALTFEILGDLTGRTVLDIGCGSGPYLVEALARGAAHVIGIDPAPGMLQLAQQRLEAAGALDRAELIAGYFPEKATASRADVAIVMGVLDYVENPVDFLRALTAAARRGAVLSFPSKHWFRSPLRKIRYRLRHCPLFLYSEDELRALMSQSGVHDYRIKKIAGAGMDYVVWIGS